MAHMIDTSVNANGAAFFANTPAWHGLGTVLDHPPTWEEAIKAASLDWRVEKRPLLFPSSDGSRSIPIENTFVTVRCDSEAALGLVSDEYEVFQNEDLFNAAGVVLQDHGLLYESAGALNDGQRIWILARHPKKFEVAGDKILRYVLGYAAHDGSGSILFGETDVRVVCNNTLTMALGSKRGAWISMRHISGLAERIKEADVALGKVGETFAKYKKDAEILARFKMKQEQVDLAIEAVVDEVFAPVPKGADEKTVQKALLKRQTAATEMKGLVAKEAKTANVKIPNAWLVGNALGEWIDVSQRFTGETDQKAEKRFDSILFGAAAQRKAAAWTAIQQIAA